MRTEDAEDSEDPEEAEDVEEPGIVGVQATSAIANEDAMREEMRIHTKTSRMSDPYVILGILLTIKTHKV